jgi:hypothetical protein
MQRFYKLYGRMPYKWGATCPILSTETGTAIRVDMPEVWQWHVAIYQQMRMCYKSSISLLRQNKYISNMKILGKKTYPPVNDQVMFPTPELRYANLPLQGKTLQQKWVNPVTGEDIWKNIPTV